MLDKLKQWTQRVWGTGQHEGCREEVLESALRSLQESRLDPRELPRPHRHYETCESQNQSSTSVDWSAACCCRNCSRLSSELLECAICLERLEDVTSCLECGNVACVLCASRLPKCPFCRSEPGLLPNKALQRLLCKLDIPCRKSMLPIRCPHKKCKWRGDIDGLSSHLEHIHLVTILNGSSVTLDIADFQRKAELSESRPRHYSVLLACFSDVFVCKVRLHHGRLRVALRQLTQPRMSTLAAWVDIRFADKMMKDVLPLNKNKSDIEVPVASFITSPVTGRDRVSISISIRPIS